MPLPFVVVRYCLQFMNCLWCFLSLKIWKITFIFICKMTSEGEQSLVVLNIVRMKKCILNCVGFQAVSSRMLDKQVTTCISYIKGNLHLADVTIVVNCTFQSMSDSADRRHLVLYVLFGLAGILAVIFFIIFLQYCRLYRMDKQEELDGLVSNSVTPEEYEVEPVLPCFVFASFPAVYIVVR